QLLRHLRVVPLPVSLLTDQATRKVLRSRVHQVAGMTMLEVQPAPMSVSERAAKRTLDVIVASLALFLLAPLMLLVMAAIKLESRGPALFRQSRRGFNGVPFKILKFRSMTVMEDGGTVVQARPQDARVTRVGRFIRATSIDEWPQLWNILRGEMSLVGPRPHAIAHDNQFAKVVADYAFRHHIKPGLTGWAQVNGSRGATPTTESIQRRVDLDLWYVNNRSFALDLWILVKTALLVFRIKNVY
ncbi:MAG: exopolysaccharide biosynthesis polyprenyl glycosylphosphotransferase, partial [Beijerinckiaceae bacterium]